MAHAQKPDFVFRRNGQVHVTRLGRQFIRLLAADVCRSAGSIYVVLETPCSAVLRGMLDTHSVLVLPLHFPSDASPCALSSYSQSKIKFALLYFLSAAYYHQQMSGVCRSAWCAEYRLSNLLPTLPIKKMDSLKLFPDHGVP
jgi:hypothetical protein